MPINIDNLWVFRIIPIHNLEHNLTHGLYSKRAKTHELDYKSIGSEEVIKKRDTKIVECYPDYVVNDFVPFYFSVRTPMLYNIKTGHGVPPFPQEDIIYLCCKFTELASDDFTWCYTNGNASVAITKYFSNLENIETDIDWRSINTADFRDDNADGDEDRIRKKHAELLIKEHVPANYIKRIVVYNQDAKKSVKDIVKKVGADIDILVNPNSKFYF